MWTLHNEAPPGREKMAKFLKIGQVIAIFVRLMKIQRSFFELKIAVSP